jgi:lipoyl synthase
MRTDGETAICGTRLPPWMRRRRQETAETLAMKRWLRRHRLNTVCQSAGCPNLYECFRKPSVTFIILGDICTRRCTFCGVNRGIPLRIDFEEPLRVAEAVRVLSLRRAVITSVTRDDLQDGGSAHFADTLNAVKSASPGIRTEALVPDFAGSKDAVRRIVNAQVDVFAHNIETVPRLYPAVRPQADFTTSLGVLENAARLSGSLLVKSGLMLGLGETEREVACSLRSLFDSGCRAVSIGQYLMPGRNRYPVHEYVAPERFERIREEALQIGFEWVSSGPFVRSSYRADESEP